MASRISRLCSACSTYRCVITLKKQNLLSVQSFCRTFSSPALEEKEGLLKRIKKYAFGEEPPPRTDVEESYYELSRGHEPLVYDMEDREICERVKRIVREALPESKDDWSTGNVDDITMKYKILGKCYQEFGVLVPNNQLSTITKVQDILNFYRRVAPEDKRTFKSIDMENLPPNLIIGGKVPRKEMS